MTQAFEYLVMDGRAVTDIDSAQVLEMCGRKRPSDKTLDYDWGNMRAYLCRAPVISEAHDETQIGAIEIIKEIA
jgi:hypothetical protein